MKKTLALVLALIVAMTALAGCGSKSSSVEIEVQDAAEAIWADVATEYEALEAEAKAELSKAEAVTKEDILSWVNTIESDLKALEDGQKSEIVNLTKELFKLGSKLDALDERGVSLADNDAAKLGADVKALVRELLGAGEEDLSTVKARVLEELQTVKSFSDEQWQNIEEALNK